MRVFIGGVIQGSKRENELNDQGYRQAIREAIESRHPGAEILDPVTLFPDSVTYDGDRARQVLFDMAEEAATMDVVVAYLPQASMGTALEMIRAYDAGTPVVSISPMKYNWFIRSLSRCVFPTLEAFVAWVAQGGLETIVGSAQAQGEG